MDVGNAEDCVHVHVHLAFMRILVLVLQHVYNMHLRLV